MFSFCCVSDTKRKSCWWNTFVINGVAPNLALKLKPNIVYVITTCLITRFPLTEEPNGGNQFTQKNGIKSAQSTQTQVLESTKKSRIFLW